MIQTEGQRDLHAVQAAVHSETIDPINAAEIILKRFGARAITILTQSRILDDGRTIQPRLGANDCYVVLEEACSKMARVALRKFRSSTSLQQNSFTDALSLMFPDAAAYLTRCIRSVISDAERTVRREVPTISMDQPVSAPGRNGESALCLRDTFQSASEREQPEAALEE